jgi:dinuclear metal center YbgI/SA1388 family protein
MAALTDVVRYLDTLLEPRAWSDSSLNGVQVESPREEVHTVAYAVDAGLSIIERAVELGAHLLIVHHGIFWGQERPITGALAKKVRLLLEHGCTLYASHLPLDGHPEVGNNALLGRYLGATNLEGFLEHKGKCIGMKGVFATPIKLEQVMEMTSRMTGFSTQLALPFGKEVINTVAVVSGSGSSAIQQCADEGIELLVTGEAKQEAYHHAKERHLNVLFAGHYATETFGVEALGRRLEREFGVRACFIDEKTGI